MVSTAWSSYSAVPLWLEEEIWGHRLYDESTPEFITLEFLNVLSALRRGGRTPLEQPDNSYNGSYMVAYRRSWVLRTILFNNPGLREPLARSLDDSECWQEHCESLYRIWDQYRRSNGAVPDTISRYDINGPEGFAYLQDRFHEYETYARLVEIMQRTSVEFESKKRWTSKFLFPYSELALFADINDKTFSTDRRFFARSGELAYLMLSYSGYGPQIWEALCKIVFDEALHAKRWERVIRPLMHERDLDSSAEPTSLGYLPDPDHRLFKTFGEDTLQLLRSRLPEYDVLPFLSRVVGFHLLNYLLTVASDGLFGEEDRLRYVLEIRRDRPDVVRRLARRQYQMNNELSLMRVNAELENIKAHAEVEAAVQRNDREALQGWLMRHYWNRVGIEKEAREARTAESLWRAFENAVRKKHKGHLASVHHEYARSCGLASREGTRAYRYSPTDMFLRMLVLANVERRMEYEAFLDRLYKRYGFVIAKRHANTLDVRQDLGDFDANDRRLRTRLANLGLLRIMSDDLAFVINRYREEG